MARDAAGFRIRDWDPQKPAIDDEIAIGRMLSAIGDFSRTGLDAQGLVGSP